MGAFAHRKRGADLIAFVLRAGLFLILSSMLGFCVKKINAGDDSLLTAYLLTRPKASSSCTSGSGIAGASFSLSGDGIPVPHVSDEILVTVQPGSDSDNALRNSTSLTLIRTSTMPDGTLVHHLSLNGESYEAARARLEGEGYAVSVQPNYMYRAAVIPNDTYFNFDTSIKQWGLQTPSPGLDAVTAWGPTGTITDCSSIVVAVLDSGVDYTHPDLSGNMWTDASGYHGYDFIGCDSYPLDEYGHGTHVAGIIGAQGNNAIGVAGVCWTAKIMSVRVLDSSGGGTTDKIALGIYYAVDHGAKVINASFGGPGGASGDLLDQAILYAKSQGVIFIAAAGNNAANNDTTPTYPANYRETNMLSVAAVASDESLASFSNYGLTTVDVGAPGDLILSTYPTILGSPYAFLDGTSMAVPFVSGLAALRWAQNTGRTYSQIISDIKSGGVCLSSLKGKTITGKTINAKNTIAGTDSGTCPP